MERFQLKAWGIIIASLATLPPAFLLSAELPGLFLIVSVLWLVSPALFVDEKPFFNLTLAHSLFFLVLYVRVFVSVAARQVDPELLFSYHLEQGSAFLVLILLVRRFYSLSAIRFVKEGLIRSLVIGLLVGLSFGVLDHLSGEGLVLMPEMGLLSTLVWVASLSLLVGLLEETLFRGVLYRPARNLIGPRSASIFQAVLFASVHYPNPASALAAALLFAVIMVYLVERTGNIITPAIAHFGNNTVWMMLGRFYPLVF
jgi:membrane protease YdiL (CAAX protease family)